MPPIFGWAAITLGIGPHSSYYMYCALLHCIGGQSYCVGLWVGHRYKEPVLQAAHASWSLGATIGPFIIGPFLVELSQTNVVKDIDRNSSSSIFEAAGVTALMSNYSRSAGMLVI